MKSKKEHKKKIIHVCNITYCYDKKKLEELTKANPGFLINKAQLMILYPWLTSNFIKHKTSPRCKNKMPCQRKGNKPFFILNQVDAYLNKAEPKPEKEEEREGKKGNLGNAG